MKDICQDMSSLIARAADVDLAPEMRSALDGHLATCEPCRQAATIQRDVHALLRARAENLQVRASDTLRARVETQVGAGNRRQPAFAPFRLPVAATLLLTCLVLGTYGLTSSSTVLAAQLALDHLKCVKLIQDSGGRGIDPVEAGREWTRVYSWTLTVPSGPADGPSRLVGVRRCLYGHGHLAHLLYEVNGEIVSLFIMPRTGYQASEQAAFREVIGQQTRMWADGDQTFALVGGSAATDLAVLERQFREVE
jgi:anti-sigma factor RsiW